MRDLRALLAIHDGRDRLCGARIFTDQAAYLAALRPPQRQSNLFGLRP
jgi:hypothetical protein